MIISVHVHDDGDIELTRHDTKPSILFEDLTFANDEEALRRELLSYGAEEQAIEEALKLLETEQYVTV